MATVEIREQKAEVEKQKEEIEGAHKEIIDSIAYAKRIQTAILPPPGVVKEYLKESFILYKPKDVVAGDFYWLESFAKATDSEGDFAKASDSKGNFDKASQANGTTGH
ncbi:MAG: hypothetical protein HRT71_11995 [Flavobacteriales bacterium]|nr:hypothetical protein [Flavobacteriales bacterium]